MKKFVGCLLLIAQSLLFSSEYSPESLRSRFLLTTDPREYRVADIPLRIEWWSRPFEYVWASQFVGEDLVVLDAACGLPHPFKWYLGQTCKEAWACDDSPMILSLNDIFQSTFEGLGEEALFVLTQNPNLYENVLFVQESICSMPEDFPLFDRIFCISTLDDMNHNDRKETLREFSKHLAPDGLLIITVDYPKNHSGEADQICEGCRLGSCRRSSIWKTDYPGHYELSCLRLCLCVET